MQVTDLQILLWRIGDRERALGNLAVDGWHFASDGASAVLVPGAPSTTPEVDEHVACVLRKWLALPSRPVLTSVLVSWHGWYGRPRVEPCPAWGEHGSRVEARDVDWDCRHACSWVPGCGFAVESEPAERMGFVADVSYDLRRVAELAPLWGEVHEVLVSQSHDGALVIRGGRGIGIVMRLRSPPVLQFVTK